MGTPAEAIYELEKATGTNNRTMALALNWQIKKARAAATSCPGFLDNISDDELSAMSYLAR